MVLDGSRKGLEYPALQRLGEMNPEQLWTTTMNPENRVLLQVSVEDALSASDAFEELMGDRVEPRRDFIERNAPSARELDILKVDLKKLEDEGPRLSDKPQKIPDELPDGVPVEKHVALSWLLCVGGWLCCAFMCLWLMVELESWPNAYDMFFWAIILILLQYLSFSFRFIAGRQNGKTAFYAVLRLCVGEGLVLLIFLPAWQICHGRVMPFRPERPLAG